MIGYIKGYDICCITKKKINKEDFLSELISVESNIKEEIIDTLEKNGYVIGLKKKKILKAVYIFNLNKEEKVLTFSKSVLTKEINDEVIKKLEEAIIEELKEKVTMEEVVKVDWNDIEIKPRQLGGFSGITFSVCLSLGLIYGMLFDNLSMGLLFGVAIGLCWGSVVKKKEE